MSLFAKKISFFIEHGFDEILKFFFYEKNHLFVIFEVLKFFHEMNFFF